MIVPQNVSQKNVVFLSRHPYKYLGLNLFNVDGRMGTSIIWRLGQQGTPKRWYPTQK